MLLRNKKIIAKNSSMKDDKTSKLEIKKQPEMEALIEAVSKLTTEMQTQNGSTNSHNVLQEIKDIIPDFSGKSDLIHASIMLDIFKYIKEEYKKCDFKKFRPILMTKFRDGARTWLMANIGQIENMDVLIEKFEKQFWSEQVKNDLKTSFYSSKYNPTMGSVTDYINKWKTEMSPLINEIGERHFVETLAKQLPYYLSSHLQCLHHGTVEELLKITQNLESLRVENRRDPNHRPQQQSYQNQWRPRGDDNRPRYYSGNAGTGTNYYNYNNRRSTQNNNFRGNQNTRIFRPSRANYLQNETPDINVNANYTNQNLGHETAENSFSRPLN
jgi:hypothetical protein